MRKLLAAATLLLCVVLSANVLAQTSASLSGTVTDTSDSVLPGVTVTATNGATGVVTTIFTNDSGAYSFPSLMPGDYTVSAQLAEFQTQTFTDVELQAAGQRRLNFTLEVSAIATQVQVTTSAKEIVLESSSSVGDVLSERVVTELPQVNRNALDMVKVMSGVILNDDTIFAANASSFAGVNAAGVNIQRDGVTVNDVRWPTGLNAATRVNPDLVGEFRMVLAPVDAEVGRGNAQLQISTKSGSNEYHGSLVWNAQNTALDPNTWEQNRTNSAPPWRNQHQYTISVGGPIIKNKTFFFALFDGQVARMRTDMNLQTLTPCAKRGVFRFYDDWNNGNALQLLETGSTPRYASVDLNGNPIPPPYADPADPNSGPHNGIMRYASVWGEISNLATLAPDCSNLEIGGEPFSESDWVNPDPWDPNRPVRDPSGFIDYFLTTTYPTNNYERGDGLNTAGYKYPRTLKGADNRFGVGEDTYRKQINVRIDHILTNEHRIHGSWSYERDDADNNFFQTPDGYGGHNFRKPMVLTANLTSTLRPNILNEFRFGMSRTGTNGSAAYNNPQDNTGEKVRELYRSLGMVTIDGQEVVVGPGMGAFSYAADTQNGNFYGGRGNLAASIADTSPRWTFGDTVSWTRGSHSIRFGGEFRRQSSLVNEMWTGNFFVGHNPWPYIHGGEGPVATPNTFDHVVGNLAGSGGNSGNQRALRDLLVFQTGSADRIHQWRYINNINDTTFNDPLAEPAMIRDTVQKEFSFFFKDDWKVTSNLTLNLGARYDYYGVPHQKNGMTTGLFTDQTVGGNAIFGPTVGFENWFIPGASAVPTALVTLQSIDSGSPNPDLQLYSADVNNFGPAIGFAYQLPWFGKGRTTIRGGYQISYIGMSGNFSTIESAAGRAPGLSYLNTYSSVPEGSTYLGLQDVPNFNGIPLPEGVEPGFTEFTLYDRQQNIAAFAGSYEHPYVQNITVALTRNLTSSLTVDMRYIGTLTRKNFSSLNLNMPNFITNGLLEAFDAVRRGENPALLDDLMAGLVLGGGVSTPIGQGITAGEALRASAGRAFNTPRFAPGWFQSFNTMLANGDYDGLANALNYMALPGGQTGEYIEINGFPVNFIKASPQFNNATLYTNQGHSNYHSMQAQVTMRPTHGVNFQSTYTWSKNLGISPGGTITDPTDIWLDYGLLGSNRTHNWVTYGGFELPMGPGKLLGRDTTGALARVLEGWQTSWITNVTSGSPLTISANNTLYANGVPDEVNEGFDFDTVGVYWPDGAQAGNYFGNRYSIVNDPICSDNSIIDPSIQGRCTLNSIEDNESGNIVLRNALPGKQGNFGTDRLTQITRWSVDMALSKSVKIMEGKTFRIRVDASNILNHPFPSGTLGSSGTRIVFPTAPSSNINGGTFGAFEYKVGGRTFQFMARLDF
ncbi:MAG: TonB-dependent receptor [Acidobacteriota bacterium]